RRSRGTWETPAPTAASGGGTFLLSLTLQEDKVHKGETPRELWPRPQPSRGSRCRLPGRAGPRRGDSSPEPEALRPADGGPPDPAADSSSDPPVGQPEPLASLR